MTILLSFANHIALYENESLAIIMCHRFHAFSLPLGIFGKVSHQGV